MALAYPEGECFFVRNGLRARRPTHYSYDANNPNHFKNHMMVEYIWNRPAHSSWDANSGYNSRGHDHPRTAYTITRVLLRSYHGGFNYLPFSYGASESSIRTRVQHELCTHPRTFDDWWYGASDQSWFMHMPMPHPGEWIWIDMVAHIRAIYLPLSYYASESNQNLCCFVQINFAQNRTVAVWRGGNSMVTHAMNITTGLGVHHGHTIGLNVHELLKLLALPRQLRKQNPYAARLIKIVPNNSVATQNIRNVTTYRHEYDVEWLTVAKANFGLDLQWKPAQRSSWLNDFFRDVLTNLISMIPVAGPFLAILFPVAWTLVVDPDSAWDMLRDLVPGINLTDQMVRALLLSLDETKEYLPDGWELIAMPQQPKSVAMIKPKATNPGPTKEEALTEDGANETIVGLAFCIAEDILAKSGKERAFEHHVEDAPPDEGGHPEGDIEKVNPPSEFPDQKEGDEGRWEGWGN
ncbi:hypothetical protein sscle_11g085350 [Sclerotinia sclerotiorum 1980 UF-70]|uniref:Uncharacterized protein n=2 Tax=Sclerotinia sclerotiorum (strain ATCC 18683 / 1980 / Ss-1) TaxID=665079 RepID=A0A1D9QFQ5_SCLS1|nr:hypothetical protein sscle_11g085350 [Sclerotinia sclerotiorum 1980 UF-70]